MTASRYSHAQPPEAILKHSREHPRTPAVQYLRMSTDNQRYSLENQARVIGAYAEREGYDVLATYEDSGRSGVTIAHRDGLKTLLRDVVCDPAFAVILVLDVSRWGRFQNPDEAAHYEYLCRHAGVDVRYCAEPFEDDGTPTSALMKSLKRVMAAEYSRQLSERTRVGLGRAAMSGTRAGGRAPFGFDRQVFNSDGSPGPILRPGELRSRLDQSVRLVAGDPQHVATLRRIFTLFTDDLLGPSDIARKLNDERVPYTRPGGWNSGRVKAVLTNEIATGIFAFHRSVWRLGKSEISIPKAEWRRLKVTEALVSPELFSRAQVRFFNRNGHRLSDADLIEQATRLLKRHGYLSRRLIAESGDVSCPETYIRRFGSMEAVYKQAGYTRSRRSREHAAPAALEQDEIVNGLRRLLAAHGYLSGALINQTPDLPYSDTIRRRFGSLDAAYKRAGYTVSRKEVLIAAWKRRKAKPQTRR